MAVALAVKVLIIVAFVVLPTEVAISLGAVHGVALAVAAGGVAAALLIRRRRRADPQHGHDHQRDAHGATHRSRHGSTTTQAVQEGEN
jgi:hypothetical protein